MTKEEIQKNSEHWYNKYKDAEKQIAELEKENAELKERLAEVNLNGNIVLRELTKAKEEIRSLYSIIQYRINYENNIEIADEMWRAKQFLKESE